MRHRAHRGDEAQRHRLVIDLPEEGATGHPGSAGRRVDPHVTETRQIDHHAGVAGRLTGMAVAPAFDRQQEAAVVPGEVHRGADVGGAGGLGDQRRMFVERGIEDLPGLIVAVVAGQQHRAPHAGPEVRDRLAREGDPFAVAGDGAQILGEPGRLPEQRGGALVPSEGRGGHGKE